MTRTVAIVGGGFCGTLVAVHLLRGAPPQGLRVVLINQSGQLARGVAYGTRSDRHVLNVPAGGMSALPDEPEHFLRYCQQLDPATRAGDFICRSTYGTYLGDLLDQAARQAPPAVTLDRRLDAVVSLDAQAGGGVVLHLQSGQSLRADDVVLAFGHFPPATPAALDPALRSSDCYVADPWASGVFGGIDRDEPVLLLGSGLTALDVVLALHQQGHRGTVDCLSRRGLSPLPHRPAGEARPWSGLEAQLPRLRSSARAASAALRAAADQAAAAGHEWRDVIAALRPYTPSLWQAWPRAERQRFLRHLQPYWDVHRHRCAPAAAATWAALMASGQLRLHAGRLCRTEPAAAGWRVHWHARGSGACDSAWVARVINCTGPATRLDRSGSPLIDQLLRQGGLHPDGLDLGLAVADDYRVLRADGRAWPSLRYVGPLLKARDWEATAVPELRLHAQAAASQILKQHTSSPKLPPYPRAVFNRMSSRNQTSNPRAGAVQGPNPGDLE